MGKNTGHSSRSGTVKERAQAKNPPTNRYVKIDTKTGRNVDQKKTPGPYKGIKGAADAILGRLNSVNEGKKIGDLERLRSDIGAFLHQARNALN